MKIRAAILVVVFSLLSCVGCSSPAQKILSADNVYYYYLDFYNDMKCDTLYSVTCPAQEQALGIMWTKLDRAKLALKRGGALPLQLKDLKEAEKKLKKASKK